jgi:23S rRNA pseudouridine955/2504/2580 synthase
VDKRYLALVKGVWELGARDIEAPLAARRREGEVRVRVDEQQGKLARSRFRLVEAFGPLASRVEVQLFTGRTHQIRVHAAHLGHPLAGDDRYGEPSFDEVMRELGLGRMFLHAHSLAFVWPDTGQEFAVSVPLPEELKNVLDALAAGRPGSERAGGRRRPPRR